MSLISEKEKQITEFWKKNKIFEKSVNERSKDKQYFFMMDHHLQQEHLTMDIY